MSRRGTQMLKLVLDGLHVSGLARATSRWFRGRGAIVMLHQVCEPSGEAFEPSRILQVSPEFLETSIQLARDEGFDLISLDELHQRLSLEGDVSNERPFICFTLDDGYRDNLTHAMPVFESHGVPFAIYLPDSFADGDAELWWLVLEAVIRKADRIEIRMSDAIRVFDTSSLSHKEVAHGEIYWWLRSIDEHDARDVVRELALEHDVDSGALARRLLMTWDEVRQINKSPLATIAAHTSGHFALAKLPEAEMSKQVLVNLDRLEVELGTRPEHFSYPYGCTQSAGAREFSWIKSLGLKTAVTTRKGMIFPEHADHMTALPRLSLNGDFQEARHLKVLLSGAPFALLNKGRRLNVD